MAGGVLMSPIMTLTQPPMIPTDFSSFLIPGLLILFVGVSGFGGQYFKTAGLKYESAGPAAMMLQLDLVFALIFQSTIFKATEPLNPLSLIGCLLITSVAFMLPCSKYFGCNK